MVAVSQKARHETRKSRAAYAPLRGVMGMASGEKVKMEERLTPVAVASNTFVQWMARH